MATQRGLWVSQRMHGVEVIVAGHLERLCLGAGFLPCPGEFPTLTFEFVRLRVSRRLQGWVDPSLQLCPDRKQFREKTRFQGPLQEGDA